VRIVAARIHAEYRIPAEEMEAFYGAIVVIGKCGTRAERMSPPPRR